MSGYLEVSKKTWERASGFPLNKEEVYPEHKAVQEFDLHHNKLVLEYGCGAGSDTLSYLRRGNRVTACDIVPKNIEATSRNVNLFNFTNFLPVLLENSYPLPLTDNTFDIVSSHGVIHHIIDGDKVVREFHRVLKSDGLCYLMLYTDFMYNYFESKIKELMLIHDIDKYEAFCWCSDAPGVPYARPYSENEGIELMEDCGFEVVDSTLWLNNHFCTYKGVKK